MSVCNGAHTPMDQDADLRPELEEQKVLNKEERTNCKKIIWKHLYLVICTRPNIAFVFCALSMSLHSLTIRHQIMTLRVPRYLSGHRSFALTYGNSKNGSDIKLEVLSGSN